MPLVSVAPRCVDCSCVRIVDAGTRSRSRSGSRTGRLSDAAVGGWLVHATREEVPAGRGWSAALSRQMLVLLSRGRAGFARSSDQPGLFESGIAYRVYGLAPAIWFRTRVGIEWAPSSTVAAPYSSNLTHITGRCDPAWRQRGPSRKYC